MVIILRNIFAAVVALCAARASALTPQEVFRLSEPSVVSLEVIDDRATILAAYSAIALDKDRIVTQFDLLSVGPVLRVSYRGRSAIATPARRDNRRNLCTLTVKGLNLAPSRLVQEDRAPTVGGTVYALGNTLGLGIGISDGVISGLREYAGDSYVQFTAPIAPGSQGGGLFDSEARLVGVIQYRPLGGQNVNFAQPAKWLTQIDGRSEQTSRSADWSTRAFALSREENWRALAEHAQSWLAADGNSSDAWFHLAYARLGLGEWQLAERGYREVLKREPGALNAATGAARALVALKQNTAALDLLRPWLAQHREHGELWSIIGFAELNLGHLDKSETAFQEAIRFEPWNREARFGLVSLARSRQDWRSALRELRVLAGTNMEDKGTWLQLAEAYLHQGRPARALASVEQILVIDPSNADALLWKGNALIALKRHREAIDVIKQSLTGKLLSPIWGWSALGDAYTEQRLWPEAIAAYREGLKLAPGDVIVQQKLGIALKDSGQFSDALALFEKLKLNKPDDPFPWRQIGFVHGYLDQADKAIPAYERSLAIDPTQPKVWRALMEAYHSAGRRDDMRRAYDKLSALDREWAEAAYRNLILPYESALETNYSIDLPRQRACGRGRGCKRIRTCARFRFIGCGVG